MPTLIWSDDFNDAVQSLPTLAGNGTITESGGNLVCDVPGGQNADWFTFGRNGILAYQAFNTPADAGDMFFSTVMSAITIPTPATSHTIWGLWQDNANFYWIYTHDALTFHAYKTIGNSWQYQGGLLTSGLPRTLRIILNDIENTVSWQVDDGAGGWTDIVAKQTKQITPDRVIWGNKNWSSLPAINSQYDSALIEYQVVDPKFEMTKRGAGASDQLTVKTLGGTPWTGLAGEGHII